MGKWTCDICFAVVERKNMLAHDEWHARVERAILGIPDPPPVPKPL